MKKIIILIVVFMVSLTTEAAKEVTISDNLINALIQVESNGNSQKIGKLGELGILQIRQCVIDDVNRVYKNRYVLSDAKNNEKAKEICRKYLKYWGNHYQKKTGKIATNQVLSKIWNGGPTGPMKKTTYVITQLNAYWNKVQNAMIT